MRIGKSTIKFNLGMKKQDFYESFTGEQVFWKLYSTGRDVTRKGWTSDKAYTMEELKAYLMTTKKQRSLVAYPREDRDYINQEIRDIYEKA